MADTSVSVDQEQLNCPICLDLLKDPVTTSCGHSFCMGCITGYLDQDDGVDGVYSCPQCRKCFTTRPVLGRHMALAEMVEKLKDTGLQAAPVAQSYAGPGYVLCDGCTGRKHRAVTSCLTCLGSFCGDHLRLHVNLNSETKHKLTNPVSHIRKKVCSHHRHMLEVFCRTDQQCICLLCKVFDHKTHDTVSAAEGRTEKLKQVGETLTESRETLQGKENRLLELRKAVESLRCSAQAAVEDSERIFTEIICSIERRRSEVTDLIRAQGKAELSQAEGLLEQLEQEIAELRRRDAELEQLLDSEDHIHFLQSFASLCASPGTEEVPSITVKSHLSTEDLEKSLSELKEREDIFCKQLDKISGELAKVQMVPPSDPKTRDDFLQYSCQLTLDPNTVCTHLSLSEGNRTAKWSYNIQPYPDHPDRFTGWYQVLCKESVSGRCYWEVEWSGSGVGIALAYKGIVRKGWGYDCGFGWNDHSWRLYCSPYQYTFLHNENETNISNYSRIGVFLDQNAGTLSFYSISDTMTLLHRVYSTFTQPLYPGFLVDPRSDMKLCPLE